MFATLPAMAEAVEFEDETEESVHSYLESLQIPHEYHPSARMFKIFHPTTKRRYQYFYTTQRWGAYQYGGYPKKHYSCKDINEFVHKYLLKEDKPSLQS